MKKSKVISYKFDKESQMWTVGILERRVFIKLGEFKDIESAFKAIENPVKIKDF